MRKYSIHIYTWTAFLILGMFMGACSEETPFSSGSGDDTSSEVRFLVQTVGNGSVEVSSRAGEEDVEVSDPRECFPVGYDFTQGKSRIRVCSVSRDPGSSYSNPDMDNPYTEEKPTGYHEYICTQKEEYEQYSVFTGYEESTPLKWDEVNEDGTVKENTGNIIRTNSNGGYYMYAAMFPYLYAPTGSTMEKRVVDKDQTYNSGDMAKYGHYAAHLLMNDLRLCYKMFGRDHFREPIRLDFYHTLCMLVVNVEIPLFNEKDATGFTEEAIVAADKMSINNIYREFKANYTKAYDRDDYVEVSPYTVAETERETDRHIDMFHTPNFGNPTKTGEFATEDAYWRQDTDHTGAASPVVWTQFCAILPPQQPGENSYISFEIGGRKYRCGLYGQPAIPLRQTYVTTLTLYIPRGESDPVIVGAHLKDWKRLHTPIISLQ